MMIIAAIKGMYDVHNKGFEKRQEIVLFSTLTFF